MVGRGTFGVVYQGKMKYYPYSVRAIKRIKKKYVKNPADILKEFVVLTTLDHPQIIKIYETFEDSENFFIVLEYTMAQIVSAREESSSKDCRNWEALPKMKQEKYFLRWWTL